VAAVRGVIIEGPLSLTPMTVGMKHKYEERKRLEKIGFCIRQVLSEDEQMGTGIFRRYTQWRLEEKNIP
jgi:hypothetical protein